MSSTPLSPSRGLVAAAVVSLSCLSSAVAWAAPTFISASRDVQVGDAASGLFHGPNSPSAAAGNFSDGILKVLGASSPTSNDGVNVEAQQTSSIDLPAGLISGDGSASVGFSAAAGSGAFAYTYLDLSFSLDGTYAFDLSGALDADIDGGFAMALVMLVKDGSTNVFNHQTMNGAVNLAEAGVLSAGSYQLWAYAVMNDGQNADNVFGGSSSFDFSLDLTRRGTVPEPSPLALLGLAAAALALRRRTRG